MRLFNLFAPGVSAFCLLLSGTMGFAQRFSFESQKPESSVLYHKVDECLQGKAAVKDVASLIDSGESLYSSFKGKTVIYRLLDELAAKPTTEAATARELFFLLANQPGFELNRRYKSLPPPFTYLLSENYQILGGQYNEAYIGSEVLRAFFEKGVSITAMDLRGNTLLLYASMVNDIQLFDYAVEKGADAFRQNADGHNAFYYFIGHGNIGAARKLEALGYRINLDLLSGIGAGKAINKSHAEMYDYLSGICLNETRSFAQAEKFVALFPEQKKALVKSYDYVRDTLRLKDEEIPGFLRLAGLSPGEDSQEALAVAHQLKLDYINASATIGQLARALRAFPLFVLRTYTADYFKTSEAAAAVCEELRQTGQILEGPTIEAIVKQVQADTRNYYEQQLGGAETVSEFAALKAGFPEKAAEIEAACFERLFNRANASYYPERWSEHILPQLERLRKLADECSSYSLYFKDPEKTAQVAALLHQARPGLAEAREAYSHAKNYEREIDQRCDPVLKGITDSKILPRYEITEVKKFNGRLDHEIEFKNFPRAYSDFTIHVYYEDQTYFISNEPLIPLSILEYTRHHSSSLEETLAKFIFQDFCDFEEYIRDMSYSQKEALFRNLDSYGINAWYEIPFLLEKCKY